MKIILKSLIGIGNALSRSEMKHILAGDASILCSTTNAFHCPNGHYRCGKPSDGYILPPGCSWGIDDRCPCSGS